MPPLYNPFTFALLPFHLAAFAVGACIGSFLNVCIWRMPRNESIIFPSSHCPACDYKIKWHENIPFISWLCLKGKCSNCQEPISVRYLLVELLTAVMITLIWFKILIFRQPIYILAPYIMVTMLVIITVFVDYKHRIIPNQATFPVMIFGLLFVLIFPNFWLIENKFLVFWIPAKLLVTDSRSVIFARACGGLVLAGGFFAICSIIGELIFKKDALGWGDVKYLAAIGATLGIPGAFFTVLFGSISGASFGIAQALNKRSKSHAIAFGPFLAVGTYLWILFGDAMFRFYFELFSKTTNQ